MEYIELGKILEYEQPTQYLVETTNYRNDYDIPVLTAGQTFILGYTNETYNVFPVSRLPVIIFDDFTTASKFVDFPFKVKSTAMKILNPVKGINVKYVYYAMQKIKFDNTLHKRYWISQYANIKIPLPEIEKQNKIADEIDRITEIILYKKEQLKILDDLVKSQFVEMFGDPITNSKKLKTEKLGNICKIYRGASPRPINKYLNGTIPWIKIGDATNGDNIYINDTKEKVTEEGAKKSRLIKKGSLIFANCGVSLGFARIINFDGCIHDGWLAFEDFEYILNPIFLLQSLNFCTEHFRSIAPDGTQPNLNTNIMKEYDQIIPNIDMQIKYVKFVEQIDKQKFEIEKSLKKMEDLYESLMNKYFG